MKTVVIESPYAGDIEKNLSYLRACMKDCLARGEAPFASHALYTQPGVLNDNILEERELGIQAGIAIGNCLDMVIVYTDLGISKGMRRSLNEKWLLTDMTIEFRSLPEWNLEECDRYKGLKK